MKLLSARITASAAAVRSTPKTWLAAALVVAAGAVSVPASAQLPQNPEEQMAALTSWWDAGRSTQYVAYVSTDFDIVVLTCGPSGCWQVAVEDPVGNVYPGGLDSTSPLEPFAGGSQLTGYFDGTAGHLFFIGYELNESTWQWQNVGDLFEEHINSDNTWSGQSVTAAAGATAQPFNGRGMGNVPWLMSSLSSMYVNGRQHVFYAGATDGKIHDAYSDGESNSWLDVPVTPSLEQSPPFMGLNLTSWYDGFEHVYSNGQEYYAGCDECGWGAGTAPAMSGYVFGETHDYQSVYGYAGGDELLTDDYFVNGWWYSDQEYAPNYDQYSPLLVYEDNSDVSPRQFYVGGDGHVYQMWDREDIMADTGAVPVAIDTDDCAMSPITGYYDGVNDHVFYVGADQHVHELYMSSTDLAYNWYTNDLSASANFQASYQLPNLP